MYATVQDMIDRFNETEMIRLSNPDDRTVAIVNPTKIETALLDATVLIDSYLRKKYQLPLTIVPESLIRAACVLARFDLAQSGNSEPSEQMRLARKETIGWLEGIAAGAIEIDLTPFGGGANPASGAKVSDRPDVFSNDSLRGW